MTGKETGRSICWSIYHWGDNIYQCSQITTVHFNENSSGYECQLSSTIQGTSRGTESRGGETSRSRRSQRVRGRKNIKQKKSKGSGKVLGTMKEIYGKIW